MEFVAKNQINHSLVFGAVHHKYVSYLGQPFKVEDKADQEFFLSKPNRFKPVGVAERVVTKVKEVVASSRNVSQVDDSAELRAYLRKVVVPGRKDGLTSDEVGKVCHAYTFLNDFVDEIEAGGSVLGLITDGVAAEAVRDFVLSGGVFPIHKGGGWYTLSNGREVRGKDKALKAQKKLEED